MLFVIWDMLALLFGPNDLSKAFEGHLGELVALTCWIQHVEDLSIDREAVDIDASFGQEVSLWSIFYSREQCEESKQSSSSPYPRANQAS